jgi:hypothetical protein
MWFVQAKNDQEEGPKSDGGVAGQPEKPDSSNQRLSFWALRMVAQWGGFTPLSGGFTPQCGGLHHFDGI